uniref:Uncharacterized protein n=1 Tax=Panagrolaimus superbus TaxID=310955 RepID=A0A914YG83_9BILA
MGHYSKTEPSVSLESDIKTLNVAEIDNISASTSELQKPQTDWRSIHVAATVTYVGAVQFSLYAASMFPYLQVVN